MYFDFESQSVKRSAVFITVLLSLFMFQSLWNVAAAFCDHEKSAGAAQKSVIQHFGHHSAPDCTQDQLLHPQLLGSYGSETQTDHGASPQKATHQHDVRVNDLLNHFNDDHSDHLPSLVHFIVVDDQQHAEQPKFIGYREAPFVGWNNLYQSPDLYFPNPPPLLSPL